MSVLNCVDLQDILPVELNIPNRDSKLRVAFHAGPRAATEGKRFVVNICLWPLADWQLTDGPALIILSLVSANIRNCSLPSSKIRALDVFLALSCHLTDEAKLDRMVPYIVDLLHDEAATVRAAGLRTLMQVVSVPPNFFASDYSFLTLTTVNRNEAHVSDSHHPVECSHLPWIYHSQYQIPRARSWSICAMHVCAVYRTVGWHSCPVFGDGSSTQSARDI